MERVAGRADVVPAAFLSYAHTDDEYDDGLITAFRKKLEGELRLQTGRSEVQIFQDRDNIVWGQAWKDRVDNSLDAVTYIIPIVSPAFLASVQCRRELERFLDREQRLGRADLVLPVYWVTVPALDRHGPDAADGLVADLSARQYADWRMLRFQPLSDPVCRKTIAELAGRLRDALNPDAATAETPTRRTSPSIHVVDSVHSGGDFTTVTDAVAAAQPGDRIVVRPGLYEGPVVLDKPVELVGQGLTSDIILAAAEGSVLTFAAPHGSVRGLTLQATGEVREPDDPPVVDIRGGRLFLVGCDISGTATGVAVHGDATPRVRRCRIHDISGAGVYVYDDGAGVFEDNEITGSTWANVAVESGGNPTVLRNRITGSARSGVAVWDDGAGVFEDNEITGNTRANVAVKNRGNPTVRRNRISGSRQSGVYVYDDGAGVFEDNKIADNALANVIVRSGGNPAFRGNRITGSAQHGVSVYDDGVGVFEDNEIADNALANVIVRSGGNPTFRGNRITGSARSGVGVSDNGAGVFEDNDITGNAWSNVAVKTGGHPAVRRNRITGSARHGVHVYDDGAGVFGDNDITGNTRSNVVVNTGGHPTVRRNRITGSARHGVHVYENGAGVFEDNTVTGNQMEDWNVAGADRTRLIRK
jgi:F-box protein 11